MGAQSTKCCCREDLDAERRSEGLAKVPAHLVHDDGLPIYNAPPYEGADTGAWQNQYHDDDPGFMAPPPAAEDGVYEQPAEFFPQDMVGVSEAKSSDKKEKKKHKKNVSPRHADERQEQSAPVQSSLPVVQEPVQSVWSPSDGPGSQAQPQENEKRVSSGPEPILHGYPDATLQIHLDHGWTEYGDNELKQVNDHLKAGNQKFAIASRGAMYMIDFSDPSNITQTNSSTKKMRNLRLVNEKTKAPIKVQGGPKAAPAANGPTASPETTPEAPEQKAKKTSCCAVM